MVLFQTVVALSEAYAIAQSAGFDPKPLFEALTKGSADSFALRNHGMKAIIPRQFPQRAFPVEYAMKDLSYALELANDGGIDAAGARNVGSLFEKAIDLDPGFASAYVGLGQTYQVQVSFGWTEFPIQVLQRAEDLALKAISFEKSNASAYSLLGLIYTFGEQYDLAINKLNRAIELNPNDARSLAFRGQVLLWSGKIDAAIQSLETAYRFDPNMLHGNFMFLGIGYYIKEQYEKSINVLKEGVSRKPDWVGNHIILAAAYAQLDRLDDAGREVQEILRLEPFFELDNYGTIFQNQADRAKIIQGLRKAGLN